MTVRQDGRRAVCQAIRPASRGGLYKAWLLGQKGERFLLGTLIPEGGALRLRRTLEIAPLERQEIWPPAGAVIEMAYAFSEEAPPPAHWCWTDCPGRLLEDKGLSRILGGVRRALLKRDGEGFWLAFPYSSREAFPLPPLFCLGRLGRLSDRWHILFRFSRRGEPEVLHNISVLGEDRGTIQ